MTASPIAGSLPNALRRPADGLPGRRGRRRVPERERVRCLFVYGTNPGGCPDPDNDRIQNTADKCWNVAGIQPNGCTDPDKDGISEKLDKCNKVPGNGSRRLPAAVRRAHPGQLGHVRDGRPCSRPAGQGGQGRAGRVPLQGPRLQGQASSASPSNARAQPAAVPAEGRMLRRASGSRCASRRRGRSASTCATASRATGRPASDRASPPPAAAEVPLMRAPSWSRSPPSSRSAAAFAWLAGRDAPDPPPDADPALKRVDVSRAHGRRRPAPARPAKVPATASDADAAPSRRRRPTAGRPADRQR